MTASESVKCFLGATTKKQEREKMNTTKQTRELAMTAIVAALYAVHTLAIAPIAYGAIQFRLSEVMTLLAFYDKKMMPGLILGCLIANLFSPFGMIDVVVGTFATALAVYAMTKTKNLYLASLMPTVFNAIIIGTELWYLLSLPLLETIGYVALGEFMVVSILGVPIYKLVTSRLPIKSEARG